MKKLSYILFLLPFLSCNGFLDEVDQDKLVPEKNDHFSALMLQEFNATYPIFRSIDHMTDNVVEDPSALTSRKFDLKTTYTWQREIELDEYGNRINNINYSWEKMYEDIAIANYVIELVDEAIGTQEENDFTKGEAYFIRGLSYFNLLNLYGQPFNPGTAITDLGVPLRDDIGVEVTYQRNTVAEGYAHIESDLLLAKELIAQSGVSKSIWHPTVAAVDLLLSRVMLYQQKWDEAVYYASEVIDQGVLSKVSANSPFVTADNQEILYSYYTTSPIFNLYSSGTDLTSVAFFVNKELINSYDDKDLRKSAFFIAVDDGTGKYNYRTKKYQRDLYTSLGFANLRVAEAYLNRAEAYANLGQIQNSVSDIQTLHRTRYTDISEVVYPTSADELISFLFAERRKELCFEDHHRWFDLRRMETQPEISHVFTLIDDNNEKLGTETFTLLPNDYNYTLPIPLKERQNNPLIRNNERYEKIPEIN